MARSDAPQGLGEFLQLEFDILEIPLHFLVRGRVVLVAVLGGLVVLAGHSPFQEANHRPGQRVEV